jgi:hypothetical protein
VHVLGWAAVAATLALSSGGVVAVATAHEGDARGACEGTCEGSCEKGCQGAHGANAAGAAPTCEAAPAKPQAQPRVLPLPGQTAGAGDGTEPIAIPLNTRGYNYDDTAPASLPPSGPAPAPGPR